MTAYSYGAVGDVQKKIIDAAITRFMFELEWFGSPEEGYRGSSWVGTIPPATGLTGTVQIQLNTAASSTYPGQILPGAKYLGDKQEGSVTMQQWEVDPWTSIYEPIIDRINTAFEGWRYLPDPADFDAPLHALEDAVDAVTPTKQAEGDWNFTDVNVSSAMELMNKWISPQASGPASSLLFAFDSAYGIPRITGVMSNQAQVAAALGYAVAGEKQIWDKARIDFMAITEEAAKVMDPTQGGSASVNLGIVKAFVDLAGVFVPKAIGSILDGISTGIGFLEEVMPKQQVDSKEARITGDMYEAIMASIEDNIRGLEWAINNEEVEICNKLDALGEVLGSRPASDFHLNPGAGIDPVFTEATEIRIDVGLVQTIGTRDIPTIAGAFLDAAELAASNTGEGIWVRENGIGWGTSGPWSRWNSHLGDFDQISTGTARELVEAGKLLAVAAGWIEGADFDSAGAMEGHQDELDRGKTDWSYT